MSYTMTYNPSSLPFTMPDLSNYVTTNEAANILGYHVNYIRQLVKRKELVAQRVGHMLFVSKESIEQYRQKRIEAEKAKTNTNQ